MRTLSSHRCEDEVEWGGDTKCEGEGEDGFVEFIMSSLCYCVHKAGDKGKGRSEGGKTGSGSESMVHTTSMGWRSPVQLAMWGRVSGVAWLWCEPIE